MLVVNNGVPKSGSTLVQRVLMLTEEFSKDIGDWQHPKWNSVSVREESVPDFLQSDIWHGPNHICLKMHSPASLFVHSNQDDIKVLTSYRNLKDSIVSMAYHRLRRHGRLKRRGHKGNPRTYWVKDYFTTPVRYGETALELGLHYLDARMSGAYLVNFDDLISKKKVTIQQLYNHLGLEVEPSKLDKILQKTDPGIKNRKQIVEGGHIRTGGISVAKAELPEFTYSQLDYLDSYLISDSASVEGLRDLCERVKIGESLRA